MMAHADGDGRRIFIRQSVTTENQTRHQRRQKRDLISD
jgi:hypothetical protein